MGINRILTLAKTETTMKPFHLHFVGVGPQKTGTSWLYQLLQHHPAICFPKDVKETMFFDEYYAKGLSWYTAHFTHRNQGQVCGEIGPTYFDVDVVPIQIHRVNPASRIIITLRNPVARALSLYRHLLKIGQINGSFSEAVAKMPRIVESGKYALHIPKWLDTFGTYQVIFILLEDIESCPQAVLKSVYDFLGIKEITMPPVGKEKINAARMSRFPRLAGMATRMMIELRARRFHKIVELGKILGFNKVYTGGMRNMPELTISEQYQLLEEYEKDVVFIENLLERSLPSWRQTL